MMCITVGKTLYAYKHVSVVSAGSMLPDQCLVQDYYDYTNPQENI